MRTYSIREVVEMFGGGPGRWLREGMRTGRFPYLQIGRERRFTETHVAAIASEVETQAIPKQASAPADVSVFGATSRSAKHHRNRAS